MIAGLKPYPAMKDSGVAWLGEVPAHWEVRRLRNVSEMRVSNVDKHTKDEEYAVRLCNYTDVYSHDRIRTGLPFMKATATTDEIERFRLQVGDVLITKDSEAWDDIGVPALVESTESDLVSGYHLALLRPNIEQINGAFLYRTLSSVNLADQLYVRANGVTRFGLSHHAIKSVWLPLATLTEQTAIVRFLDHADRRIRRYIHVKEKLIGLLEEQKQAIIHQAVTGRIDVRTGQPYPAYKPSGVEWLGDVPEHWEVRRLKWVTRLQRGYDLPADSRLPGTVPVVSSGGVIDTHVESRCGGPGVVMGRYGSTDAVFFIEQDFWPHNTSLFVTDFQSNVRKWCYYLLQTITKADHAGKSAVPGVDRKDLFQIVVPLPPVEEQQEISGHIDSATHKLSVVISQEQRQIDLLREYRTRLIADVVTGKLDVREAAAALPEVDSLAEDDEAADPLDAGDEPAFGDDRAPAEVAG